MKTNPTTSSLRKGEADTVNISGETSSTDANRLPLTKFFTTAIVSILVLFIFVTLLAFYRLLDFRFILTDLTERSVPAMAVTGQIYNQVNTLTYLTEGLSQAKSDAARRSLYQKITGQLDTLAALAEQDMVDPYLTKQIDALRLELNELSLLIDEKLYRAQQLDNTLDRLYLLYERMQFGLGRQTAADNSDWQFILADIVALSGRIMSLDRLHRIRALDIELQRKVSALEGQISTLPDSESAEVARLLSELSALLLSEDGLVQQRIDVLRFAGRATGRGNFVRNLILDYADQAQYRSFSLNDQVVSDSRGTASQLVQQTTVIGIAALLAILFLVAVVYFLQTRVVRRLVRLNTRVKQRLAGQDTDIDVGGNDEISDIAQSFDVFARTIEEQNKILRDLSLSDGLTGIANRRALDQQLEQEILTARRQQWPLSVLLLDIDYFKAFNDHYGHAKGDDCLRQIASILDHHMQRPDDFAGRYGGEEFACVLPDTDQTGATHIAEAIQQTITKHNLTHAYSDAADHVTASIGIATYQPQTDDLIAITEIYRQADVALYDAKERGRNQWMVFSPDGHDNLKKSV